MRETIVVIINYALGKDFRPCLKNDDGLYYFNNMAIAAM